VHNLSKRTELYGAYYSDVLKAPTGNEQTVVALGVRQRF
jgi:predicted porin